MTRPAAEASAASDPRLAFSEAMAAAGLACSDSIIADGKLHRYRGPDDAPAKKDGFYVLHLDGIAAGAFGHWRLHPDAIRWHAERSENISPDRRADFAKQIRKAKAKRDAEEAKQHAAAAKRAEEEWQNAKEADPDHPYLCRKRVGTHGIRESRTDGRLIVAVYVDGKIVSLQYIDNEGEKRFLDGGKTGGGYYRIGGQPNGLIYVAEGFATAASICEADDSASAYVAFNDINLPKVAAWLRKKYPRDNIIIGADNDLQTEGNPGVTWAKRAAEAVNGKVAIPRLKATPNKKCDWNDIAKIEGLAAVRRALDAAVGPMPDGEPGASQQDDGNSRRTGAAPQAPPETGDEDDEEWTAARVAGEIQRRFKDHFAQDEGHKLYVFQGGVYRPQGEERVRQRVKQIVPPEEWSVHLANETIEYIRVDAPLLWEQPPLDVINVLNGLLDVHTRELKPHSPEHLSTIQLSVRYDPKATCPAWLKQIAETFPSDALEVAFQIVAWLMLAITSIQKALLLLGPGGTGKSTFLTALIAFLGGRRNVSALALQKLETDRFAASRLIGKLANVCADLPSTHLETSSVFKLITGGDPVPAEYKFKDSFDILPFSRLIFSANQAPQSKDASDAFFDRWYVLPFTSVYRGSEAELSRKELDAKLAAPSELSGVLNMALDALPGLLAKNGLTVTQSMREAHEEFWKATDPLAIWLNQNTISDPNAKTPRTEMITAYNIDAMAQGKPAMTPSAFGLALKRLRPEVVDRQRTVHGLPNVWCYVGIGLKAQQTSAQSDESETRWWNN